MKTLSADENQKREKIEVLKIITRCRAKSIDDEIARVYEPGEEGRFSGTAKLQLLAMKAASRDLSVEVEEEAISKPKKKIPQLSKMKDVALDQYAENELGLDVADMKRAEKIATIKQALDKKGKD